ncbi:MAG: hypothetical protein IKC26_02390 [Clostridia bacterium]|nr:hypothetical protein [Clostridia bacterium]
MAETDMCHLTLRRLIGGAAVAFGAGILFSFLLPGFLLAFIEAAVLVAAGILLLGGKRG